MSDLFGYKQNLDERWDYHHGATALDREAAQQAAFESAGMGAESSPSSGGAGKVGGAESSSQSAQGSQGSDLHPLEVLGKIGETLSAPIRQLLVKGITGKDPSVPENGEYTGQHFKQDLGLDGPEAGLGKKALGLGAEILTDPTSALPIGGKIEQKAALAAKDALVKSAEVNKVVNTLDSTLPKGTPSATNEVVDHAAEVEKTIAADPTMSKAKQLALRESVGVPTSAVSKHGRAVFLQKNGADVPVIDESVGKTFGYHPDDHPLSMQRYEFLQDVQSNEAARSGLDVAKYQDLFRSTAAAFEKHPELEAATAKLLSDPAAQEVVQIAGVSGKVLGNEAGIAKIGATLLMTRVLAGAAVGGYAADDTKMGAVLGGLGALTPEGVALLVKGAKKIAPEAVEKAKAKIIKTPPPAWTPDYARKRFEETLNTLKQKAVADTKRPLDLVDQEASALVGYQDVSLDTLKAIKPNTVMNDAEIRATQLVLKESAIHLRDMAMRTDVGNPAQVQEFMKQLYMHGNADFGRKYGESALGRALGITDATKGDKEFLDQMNNIVSDAVHGVNPQRIVELTRQTMSYDHMLKFANSMGKPGFKDMYVEYWVNGLLSGPSTYALNAGGSALFHGLNMFEKGMSALYGNASAPVEAIAMLEGTMAGLKNAFRVSWESLKQNTLASLSGEKTDALMHNAITAENVKNLSPIKGLTKMVAPEKADLERYGPVSILSDYMGHAINAIGTAARHPRLIMLSQDEFTKSIAASSEIYRHAALSASADVERAGLTGKAARDLYAERKKYWIANPTPSAVAAGKDYGAYITFMKELGPAGQSLKALTSSSILAKTALPVLSAPINVAKAGFLQRTPLGLGSKDFWRDIVAGGEKRQMALTRMSVGASVVAMATEWATNGFITAPPPDSPEMKKALREGGQLPFSLNITAIMNGGPTKPGDSRPQPGDQLVDFNRLDPALMPAIAFGVILTQQAGQVDEGDYEGMAAELSIALGEKVSEKSFLTGVSRFTSVLADPHQHLETFLKQYPATLVPASSLMNSVARQVDPIRRDPQTLIESIYARLPFLSRRVVPDRNRYGEEVHYTPGLGPDMASPLYTDTVKDDPVLNAYRDDQISLSKMPARIGNLALDAKQRDQLIIIMGQEVVNSKGQTLREAEEAVLKEAERDKHTIGPGSWRAAELRKIDNQFRTKARLIFLRRNPEFAQAALDDDRERLRKLDKNSESDLLGHMTYADQEGVDVKKGKSKSHSIPFKVR